MPQSREWHVISPDHMKTSNREKKSDSDFDNYFGPNQMIYYQIFQPVEDDFLIIAMSGSV